jgi:predicted Zn-dependent protease
MAKSQLGGALAGAAGVAARDDYRSGRNTAAIAAVVNQMLQLRFSRKDELEADDYGLNYMAQAGYDPQAMLGVMKILAEASKGNRQPAFLATHPHPDSRLEKIKTYLSEKYPDGVPQHLTQGRELHPQLGDASR